jgi:hypothetical protein
MFTFTALWFRFTITPLLFTLTGSRLTPTTELFTLTAEEVVATWALVPAAVGFSCLSDALVPLEMPYTLLPIRSSVMGTTFLGSLPSASLIFSATCSFLRP